MDTKNTPTLIISNSSKPTTKLGKTKTVDEDGLPLIDISSLKININK